MLSVAVQFKHLKPGGIGMSTFGKRKATGFGGVERRRTKRTALATPGAILFGVNESLPCVVENASEKGARLLVQSVLGIPDAFRLRVGGVTRSAKLLRTTPGRLYVRF